jgi:hypothetical protein
MRKNREFFNYFQAIKWIAAKASALAANGFINKYGCPAVVFQS